MKQSRRGGITSVNAIIMLFLYVGVAKVAGQSASAPLRDSVVSYVVNNDIEINDSGCECIKYDCGCCQYMEWDAISLDGTLCANASYLEKDYGISITVTFNNYSVINETISARNPPPICVGEDIVNAVKVEICLHIFDIDIESNKFHVCFEILGKFMKIKTPAIKLGCINTKLEDKLKYVENKSTFYLARLFNKKKTEDFMPNVIQV